MCIHTYIHVCVYIMSRCIFIFIRQKQQKRAKWENKNGKLDPSSQKTAKRHNSPKQWSCRKVRVLPVHTYVSTNVHYVRKYVRADGRTDVRTYVHTYLRTYVRTDGRMDVSTYLPMDGRTDGRTDG